MTFVIWTCMIPAETFGFWTFILGSAVIVWTAFLYGEARTKARKLGLTEIYRQIGLEDIESD